MPPRDEKIKLIEGLLAHGLSLTEAVAKALGRSLSQFAESHGFNPAAVSMCLLGYHQRTYPEIRDAVCAELEITRATLDSWIEQRPSVNTHEGVA